MIGAIVEASIKGRLLVVLFAVLLTVVGVRSYMSLPVDAVPDVTNVQVQVLTNAPGLSPLEVEALVTRPIELALMGLPRMAMLRSVSRSGISAVTVIFDDDLPLAEARTLVDQRLPAAREAVLGGVRPEMGPLTTGLGEVFHFTMSWPGHSAAELRTVLDWEISLGLRSVPGVVEVNGWGGDTRQVEVRMRRDDMIALGVTQRDIEEALLGGGRSVGGGAVERGGEQVLIRLDGQYRTLEQVGSQVVATRPGGTPVLVRDVATVRDGTAFRLASATADGKGETVYGMVQMVAGGNARDVVLAVRSRLAQIEKTLPPGVKVEPFQDRAALVDRVIATVRRSLLEGGAVVIAVLFLLLGDVGAGIVAATAIPLSMLGAFTLMRAMGLTGNLMSLGAIDFGLVVDGAVVVVEGALATMAAHSMKAHEALEHEGRAVGRPIAFGVFIIAIVYVPVLLLEGTEGKMFRPMAFTVLFALGTSLVLTFTWIPAIASLLLRKAHEREPLLMRAVRRLYRPSLRWALAHPRLVVSLAGVLVTIGIAAAVGRGAEFVPRLEEGDLVVQLTRPPSVSLAEATEGTLAVERALHAFPEVNRVVSRTGSPDVATDVMGVEQSDVFVTLHPRETWKTAATREALVEKMDEALHRALPGTAFAWTQPIEMRTQELLGGTRSDVGIKVHGDDLPTLARLADEIARTLGATPGSADVRVEPTSGLPIATLRLAGARAGRLGVRPDEVRAAVEAVRAGRPVGTLVEGERRFDVVVRSDTHAAPDAASLARLPLVLPGGKVVPVGDVADVEVGEAPAQIGREQARRRVQIECNVRGRDLASFVQDARARVDRVALPPGYHVSISGQYESLVRASQRLALIVPATLAVIFVLLYLTFGEAMPAALILLNVPAATSGGIVSLWARDLPFSIAAAVGFIALFGVATMNGVVLLSALRRLREAGLSPVEAAEKAGDERLRPVLTTALVAAVGFLPMAIATGTGAEVQRPLATVVIGGLGTSTLLTLLALPTLHALIDRATTSDTARDDRP